MKLVKLRLTSKLSLYNMISLPVARQVVASFLKTLNISAVSKDIVIKLSG